MKTLFWLAVFAAVIYICFKTIPVFVNSYELEDAMKTEARFAAVQRRSDDEIRNNIFRKIQDLELPIRREDIRITRLGYNTRIDVQYSVDVILLGYTWTINFKPSVDSRSL